MTRPYFKTGSGELPCICFVDGQTAHESYGVDIKSGGPCPKCGFPVETVLYFNPTDGGFYFNCPVCGVWVRWLSSDGTLSDFKVVTSTKNTDLDEDSWDYTPMTGTF